MAKKEIIFKLLAYSDAAGKYNPEAPLNGNEDNFYVDDDLSDDIPGRCQMDKDVIMSDCGCLMVVADGMGGMNAGEVASDIAISTVKEYFAPGKITPKMAQSSVERRRYLEMVIKEADKRVKKDAKENTEHEGMGSTIIIAWIVGDKVTISWCGDSRAYRFNPLNGIEPLSTDHSYVQELVNQNVITYEDTFEHPQGNIVTRSLGDPNHSAKPDTREFEIYNGDIILLCSDGLSGVLRDKKTKDHNGNYYPGDNIEDIISTHTDSLTQCREALMDAAEKADWYDNVTVLMCKIESGLSNAPKKKVAREEVPNLHTTKTHRSKTIMVSIIIAVCVIGLCGTFYYLGLRKGVNPNKEGNVAQVDSLKLDPIIKGEDIENPELLPQEDKVEKRNKGETNPASNSVPKEGGKRSLTNEKSREDVNPKLSGSHSNNSWKAVLLAELNRYTQAALKNVVAETRQTIEEASDDDQDKCQKYYNQVVKRAEILGKLRPYSGKLTKRGEQIFDAVLSELGNPNTYNPDFWNKKIKELNKYLKSSSNPELFLLTPDEDGGPDESKAPDYFE